MDLGTLIAAVIQFYAYVIIVYVLMSWFPVSGVFEDIYSALAVIVEPYLGLFRRIIPPLGAIDISPIIAILVLNLIGSTLSRVL